MSSGFKSCKPKSIFLRKYISYFYFDRSGDADFNKKYSFFPHINTTLTFYKNADLSIKADGCSIDHTERSNLIKLLTRQHTIRTVIQNGLLDKIGIVFHPLGLNHFMSETYGDVAKKELQFFIPSCNVTWNSMLKKCFSTPDIEKRTELLETFFSARYKPKDYTLLYSVIQELNDRGNFLSIKDIAAKHFISSRKRKGSI